LSNRLAPSRVTPDVEAGGTSLTGEDLLFVQHHHCPNPLQANEDFRVIVRIDPSHPHDEATSEAADAVQRV
jgi:hypothetical protein